MPVRATQEQAARHAQRLQTETETERERERERETDRQTDSKHLLTLDETMSASHLKLYLCCSYFRLLLLTLKLFVSVT